VVVEMVALCPDYTLLFILFPAKSREIKLKARSQRIALREVFRGHEEERRQGIVCKKIA